MLSATVRWCPADRGQIRVVIPRLPAICAQPRSARGASLERRHFRSTDLSDVMKAKVLTALDHADRRVSTETVDTNAADRGHAVIDRALYPAEAVDRGSVRGSAA